MLLLLLLLLDKEAVLQYATAAAGQGRPRKCLFLQQRDGHNVTWVVILLITLFLNNPLTSVLCFACLTAGFAIRSQAPTSSQGHQATQRS
jgi:hypothetical protein